MSYDRSISAGVLKVMGVTWSRAGLDVLILAAPAWSTSMLVWARNPVAVGDPTRLLLIGMCFWVVSLVTLALLRKLRCPEAVSLVGAWAITYLLTRGGDIPEELGYLVGTVLVLVAIGIGLYLISKADTRWLRSIASVASALLVIELVITWYGSIAAMGEDFALASPEPIAVTLRQTPDIVLIVADAYLGLDGLQRYLDADTTVEEDLERVGFWLPDQAYSSYASTGAALASLFDMGYPLEGGPGITPATNRSLYARIGGDNRLVESFRSNGYEFTMIESGWSGSRCGDHVDTCIPSAFLNESVFFALSRSWFSRWVLDRSGYAFTAGARHAMDWLGDNVERITHDSTSDLVIAHLAIPHPPLFVDDRCALAVASDRSGTTLRRSGVDFAVRVSAYLEQASCVNGFVTDLAGKVSGDTVLIVVGDHGTDSQDQVTTDPREWSDHATRERLNVMFAMKAGEACRPPEPVLLVNMFLTVFKCLGGPASTALPPRMFRYSAVRIDGGMSPIVEVEPELVQDLLSAVPPG